MDQSILLKSDFMLTFFTSLVASQAKRALVTIKYLEFVPDTVTSPHPVSSYESIHAHDQVGKIPHIRGYVCYQGNHTDMAIMTGHRNWTPLLATISKAEG